MASQMTWVVIADAGRCRIFETKDRGRSVAAVLQHDLVADHRAARDLRSDRPGRTFDRSGGGRHAKEPRTDPHRHVQAEFAQTVCKALSDERGRFGQLMIVAPPSFLGDLRNSLSDDLTAILVAEVDKDLTKIPDREIPGVITPYL